MTATAHEPTAGIPAKQRLVWLDLVRGASALAVCAGHLRAGMLLDYPQLSVPNLFDRAFYFLTGLGHQAVMVFFVLSGFFVGGSILKQGARFHATEYAVARLSRLWVVLIPALLVTGVVSLTLAHYVPAVAAGTFQNLWHSGPQPDQYSTSAATFFGNVFFTQTILVPVYGLGDQLWSLANEFWYYAIFPLVALAAGVLGTRRLWVRIACGTIAVALLVWLSGLVVGFVVWLMGVVVYVAARNASCKIRGMALVAASAAFAATLVYSRLPSIQASAHIPPDLAVGAGFAALCCVLATAPNPSLGNWLGRWTTRIATRIADYSYSLYVIHFPFVCVIAAAFYGTGKMAPGAKGLAVYACWLVALNAIGVVFWWLFERRTQRVRTWIQQWLPLRKALRPHA